MSIDGLLMILSGLNPMEERLASCCSSSTLQMTTSISKRDLSSPVTRILSRASFQDAKSNCKSISGMIWTRKRWLLNANPELVADSFRRSYPYRSWSLSRVVYSARGKMVMINPNSKNLVLSSYHFSIGGWSSIHGLLMHLFLGSLTSVKESDSVNSSNRVVRCGKKGNSFFMWYSALVSVMFWCYGEKLGNF